jgi:hypothetical protein
MGQARQKLLRAGESVEFDFAAPEFHVLKGDQENLQRRDDGSTDGALVAPRACRFTITSVVKAAFPNGMDRQDGKLWAAWLEVMDDDARPAEVTRGLVEFLHKHAADGSVRVPPSLAQWREALVDYLEALLTGPPPEGQGGDSMARSLRGLPGD